MSKVVKSISEVAKSKKGFIQEFKQFAVQGNAIDLAVGVIIGAAFNKIVQSIVNDLLMPPIGLAIGGVNFRDLQIVLKAAEGEAAEVAIRYGQFINTVVEFMIIALSVFVVVKLMNKLIARNAEEAASEADA